MNITVRNAVKEDCPAMMELIKELAVYEKAPNEVTVSLDHFIESGFGKKPVWWGIVASTPGPFSTGGEGEDTPNEVDLQKLATVGLPHLQDATQLHSSEMNTGGEVIGFALYYIRYSTWKGQRMYLEDILVTEKVRGRGIGHLLMDALIAEAKEKKLKGITWQVLDWNEPAINFYKKYNATLDGEWINCGLSF